MMKKTTLFSLDERYTKTTMKVKAVFPIKRRSLPQKCTWIAAGMLVVMLVCQLFTFESFPALLATLTGVGEPYALLLATKIVLLELLAIPFLLEMKLSMLLRAVSAFAGILVSYFWLLLCLLTPNVTESGVFGATLSLGGGVLPICWTFLLAGLLSYVLYNSRNVLLHRS